MTSSRCVLTAGRGGCCAPTTRRSYSVSCTGSSSRTTFALPATELASRLDDQLYALNERESRSFPRSAREYLDDWAAPESGWLRKYYPEGSDEPHYDATPGAMAVAHSTISGNTARGGGGIYQVITGAGNGVALTSSAALYNKPDNCEPPGTIMGCHG